MAYQKDIASDRDQRLNARFWQAMQKAFGTKLNFTSSYYLETDGQTKRVKQILEDMLRACVLEFLGKWEDYLLLVEFSYNNGYQSTIKMTPFKALYGRKCRTALCWRELNEALTIGLKLIQKITKKIKKIQKHIKVAQSLQKSFANKRRRSFEFQGGD